MVGHDIIFNFFPPTYEFPKPLFSIVAPRASLLKDFLIRCIIWSDKTTNVCHNWKSQPGAMLKYCDELLWNLRYWSFHGCPQWHFEQGFEINYFDVCQVLFW